jgi:hypothetical protein
VVQDHRLAQQAVVCTAVVCISTCGAPSAAHSSGSDCRCHRVALTRAILGLQDAITMDVLFYRRDPDRGWQFKPEVRASMAPIMRVDVRGLEESETSRVRPLSVKTLLWDARSHMPDESARSSSCGTGYERWRPRFWGWRDSTEMCSCCGNRNRAALQTLLRAASASSGSCTSGRAPRRSRCARLHQGLATPPTLARCSLIACVACARCLSHDVVHPMKMQVHDQSSR